MLADELLACWSNSDIKPTEGSCSRVQIDYFREFLEKNTNVKTVLEIGFNGGLSSAAFLSVRPDIKVVSIDLGEHDYVLRAKRWIDKEFPDRHMLFIGNSMMALPQLLEIFPSFSPDLIFIDGGHDAPVPASDLTYALELARPDTWICVDDIVEWMVGIISAINSAVKDHKLVVLDQKRHDIHGWIMCKKIG
jgi:predicted O-methyltransferase YrrM